MRLCTIAGATSHCPAVCLILLTCMVTFTVRGTHKFQYSDLRLIDNFAILATLCDHPPNIAPSRNTIDHPVCVAYCPTLTMPFPFYFCASLLPSYSTSTLFHILLSILSIFHISPLSLFRDPLLVFYALCSLCSPPSLGSPKFLLDPTLHVASLSCVVIYLISFGSRIPLARSERVAES